MKILIILVCCLTLATCQLSPSGAHVCSRSVAYNAYQAQQLYRVAYQNYRTKTGWFGWSRKSVYRTYSTGYYQQQLVTRYKYTYVCCSGWSRVNNGCPTPICASGCGNGRCTSPNKCTCHSGYYGDKCQHDINECSSSPCDHNCQNLPGTYACTCRDGFTKTNPNIPTDRSCSDVNECSVPPCSCDSFSSSCVASCRNTVGSFSCSCSTGFQLNSDGGTVCVDIDECSSSTLNACQHHCYNTPGSFSCHCQTGYRLSNDSRTCTDINECRSLNGGCNQVCVNQIGSFLCACRKGFRLLYDKKSCEDINECSIQAPCDLSKSMCRNYPGSYQCVCKKGYQMHPNNRTCIDINECTTTVGICQHQCTNIEGSYLCSCNAGYRLNQDKHKCDDVDECQERSHRCDHVCQNTIGNYTCLCRGGYILNTDTFTCRALPCIRISKPVFGTMNCTGFVTDSVCNFSCSLGFDLQGSTRRTCLPITTWSGYKAKCKRKACSALSQLTHGSIVIPCDQRFGSTCMRRCQSGYYLVGKRTSKCVSNGSNILSWTNTDAQCKTITPCEPNPCHHNGDCIHLSTTEYSCNCDGTGYTGQNCEVTMVIISELPPVFVGIDSEYVAVTTQAEGNIEISIQEETGMLTFSPNSVTLKYPERKASFKIASNKPGTYKVKYKINKNKLPILPLPDDFVYVFQNDVPKPVKIGNYIFNQGCQERKLIDNISLSSTCEWNTNGTSGLVSVSAPFMSKMPLSMNGVTKKNLDTFSGNSTLEPVEETLQLLEENEFGTCPTQCNVTMNGKKILNALIGSFYFPNFVFKALENLFPSWFVVTVTNKIHKYNPENLHSKIVSAKKLEDYPLCAQLHDTKTKSHLYVVYTPKMFMNFQFQSSIQKVSDLTATCFAVNLMNGIVSVNVGKGLDISNDFTTLGIPVSYFTVSTISFIPSENKMKNCVFTGEQRICIHSAMKIKSRIISSLDTGKFTIDGNISLESENLNELLLQKFDAPFQLTYSGSLNYEIKLDFLGKLLKLRGFDQHLDGSMRKPDSFDYFELMLNPLLTASTFDYGYSTITFHPLHPFQSFIKMSIKGKGGKVSGIENLPKTTLLLRTYQIVLKTYLTQLETGLKTKHIDLAKIFLPLKDSVVLSLNALVQEIRKSSYLYQKTTELFKDVKEKLFDIESFLSTLQYWLKSKQISEFDQNISFILRYVTKIRRIEINPTSTPITFDQKDIIISYVGRICLYNLCIDDVLVELQYGVNENRVQVTATFTSERKLSARLHVKNGDMLHLDISRIEHRFNGFMNASIKIFNDFYNTVLNITESDLSYNFTVPLSSEYPFEVSGHTNLGDIFSWKNVIREIRGESMVMSHRLNMVMQRNFEEVSKETNKRLNISEQRFFETRDKLNSLKKIQMTRKAQYENVSSAHRRAYELYQHAVVQLNISQQQMDSYTYINRLYIDKNLSGICLLQPCEKKCFDVPVCQVCQNAVNRSAIFIKCDQTEEKVRTVIEKSCPSTCNLVKHLFIPYYTGTCKQDPREQARIDAALKESISLITTSAGTLIGSIFGPVGSKIGRLIGRVVGIIIGMFVSCSRTYEVAIKRIPYTKPCLLPCKSTEELTRKVSNCYNETVLVSGHSNVTRLCHCVNSCVSKVANMSCILKHTNCIKKRQEFLKSSDKIPKIFTDLYESIENQKQHVEVLRTKLRSVLHSKEFFETELEKMNITLLNAEQEHNMVKQKDLSASALLSDEICIMTMFNRHPNVSNVISFFNPVTFNTTLPFLQNMLLRVGVKNKLDGKTTEFYFLYSFDDKDLSLKRATKDILVKSLCKNKRERRSLSANQMEENIYVTTLDGDKLNNISLQKACLNLQQTADLVTYSLLLLQNLTEDALELREITSGASETVELNDNDVTNHSVLNAQSEMAFLLKYEVSVYRNRTTVTYVLTQWKQNMEFYRNEQNISSCLAFVDCLISSLSDLKNLPSNFINKDNFYSMLSNITKSFERLTEEKEADTFSLESLLLEINKLMKDIDTIMKESFHCKAIPKLTSRNTAYYDVENGNNITINCGTVQSELPVSYTWKHNEKIIDEETKNILTVTVELSDRGNYVCDVTSKVGMVSSNATYINVYEKPSFIEDLEDVTFLLPNAQNLSANFVCNVSAFPKPSYKWFFQKFDLLEEPTELAATSLVYSIPDLDLKYSGYYHCKAFNDFGKVTSRLARLDVLEFQYPASILTIDVIVSNIVIKNNSVHATEVNASFFAPIVQKMNLFDTQNITTSFNESLLTITILSFPKLMYSNETTEDILNTNVKLRQDLSVAAAVFIREISNTSIVFISDNTSYFSIVEESLSANAKFNICGHGYEIHKNGMICVQCPAGTFANVKGVCVACGKYYYQDLPGQTYCNKCYLKGTEKMKNNVSKHYCKNHEVPTTAICASGCGNGRCTSPNKCTCHSGYYGDKCQHDINECSSSLCDHNCQNLPGTYACTCRDGFTKTNPNIPTDRSCSVKPTEQIKGDKQVNGDDGQGYTVLIIILCICVVVIILILLVSYVCWWKKKCCLQKEKDRNTILHFTNRTYEPDNDLDEFAEYTVPPSLSYAQVGETKQAVIKSRN
ncbi:uncharacterized protein LOC130641759 isoform X2 [Hydractinia symbiolongicarpus]|uniref:uncharacterized protein LOC130641759 isoform X2 n=1 Tax=Hydractinia symbiolongicarpus TaxID=13093 RepID=UPI002550D154|nr:uncharacterized protein LOC130641759 isoform X2 [Hydractinia symbiolongicarpus]